MIARVPREGGAAPSPKDVARPTPARTAPEPVVRYLPPWDPRSADYRPPTPKPAGDPAAKPTGEQALYMLAQPQGMVDPFSPDPSSLTDFNAQTREPNPYSTRAEAMKEFTSDQQEKSVEKTYSAGIKGGGRRRDVYEMTPEAYAKLTGTQRAAVDFNTMLAEAVRRDLQSGVAYGAERDVQLQENYDAQVEAMFGKDGGSDTFAPQTLALLRQIDFSDQRADLDQFLKMQAAVTDKDLKGLTMAEVPGLMDQVQSTQPPAQAYRSDYVGTIAQATEAKLDEVMQQSDQLLQTARDTLTAARNEDLRLFTAQQVQPSTIAGFGAGEFDASGQPANKDAWFQKSYETLAAAGTRQEFMKAESEISSFLRPAELQEFRTYADLRSQQAGDYDRSLGSSDSVKYRSVEEFRKLLGLE